MWHIEGGELCLKAPVLCGKADLHVGGLDLRLRWNDGRVVIMRYIDLR